jgi:hypothetical protein
MKQCPSACSGHGQCLYSQNGLPVIQACLETDPTCQAICTCNSGYYSQDCSLLSKQYAFKQSSLSTLCISLYQSVLINDMSTTLLQTIASSIISLLTDVTLLTDAGFNYCAETLIEAVNDYPTLVCSENDVYESILTAFSSLLQKGQNLDVVVVANITSSLDLLTETCQEYTAEQNQV